MLVISRKAGEAVLIGDNLEISVLEVVGDKIKLGISAPRDVRVIRKELKETEQLNREAARASTDLLSLEQAVSEKKQ
ncbi:MAG: carbon storage regulator CsrA [Clostridiaceae bacterium]|nr:carbon storage regulator CsrA [Clostridiaceae bacterium]